MNYINWDHLGGMPATQDRFKFMQDAYMASFQAIGKLCGEKTILFGVEVAGGNVSSGAIVVDGEIIEFVGGSVGPAVKINETIQQYVYANAVTNNVQYRRTATCAAVGDFPFNELRPLTSLVNVWKKGDIRDVYIEPADYNDWLTDNFDVDGYGVGVEKGWRILSKQIANSAGRVLVNLNPVNPDYDTPGNIGGANERALTGLEQGTIKFKGTSDDGDAQTGALRSFYKLTINGQQIDATLVPGGSDSLEKTVRLNDDAQPHDIRQPYFVVIKLIRQ